MSELVDKSIVVFDANGNGVYSVEWPWNEEQIAHLDAEGAHYAILDRDLPDAYWMDLQSPDRDCYRREQAAASIDKTRILAGGGDAAVITGLPDPCVLIVDGEPQEVSGGTIAIGAASPGLRHVMLGGCHRGVSYSIEAIDLAAYKMTAKARVDSEAEASRNRVITPGSGQAMTYLRKAEAAKAFLAGDMPDGPQKERILDEADRLGIAPDLAAQTIIDTADAWEAMDRLVDKTRLETKKAIDEADGLDAVDAAVDAMSWPA